MNVTELEMLAVQGVAEEPSYENGLLVSIQHAPELAEYVESSEDDFGIRDRHTEPSAEYGDPFFLTAAKEEALQCPLAFVTTVINAPNVVLGQPVFKPSNVMEKVPSLVSLMREHPDEVDAPLVDPHWRDKMEAESKRWWNEQDELWRRAGRQRPQ